MIKLVDRKNIPRSGYLIRGVAILRLVGTKTKKRLRLDIKENTNMWGLKSLKSIWEPSVKETVDILKTIKSEEDLYKLIQKLYDSYKPLKIYLCANDWINGFIQPEYIATINTYLSNYKEK